MKTLLLALGAAAILALVPGPGAAQDMTVVAEGAKLYGQNCVRCHSARSPMERTDREWVTIVNHMRARANMRKSEAQAMITFLQSTNRPEGRALAQRADRQPEPSSTPVVIELRTPELSVETRAEVMKLLASLEEPQEP